MNFLKKFYNKKNYFFKIENIYYFLLILIIFFLDRYSKIKILNNFSENTFFVNNFINFDLIWNVGIGFGLLTFDSTLIYNITSIVIGIVIIILFYMAIISEKLDKLFFSIILGGAVGNFYDRITLNAVPDFIDLHYENFHWFTFNVADIFITFGIATFIIRGFFIKND